ncbi:MAG TPA: hypothetical protein VJT67_05280 [Longimicrobiaceae bacterium]|nr:hypothetical protein [Longimicrobiaceae bacterium]
MFTSSPPSGAVRTKPSEPPSAPSAWSASRKVTSATSSGVVASPSAVASASSARPRSCAR